MVGAAGKNLQAASALVIGAGPSGLATAKCLKDRGISVVIVDRNGLAGGAYRRMYPRLALSSPPRFLGLPGMGLRVTSRCIRAAEYAEYLAAYAERHQLEMARDEVVRIERCGKHVAVRLADGAISQFEAVIVAAGMCDHPARPEVPGLSGATGTPQIMHAKDWPGPSRLVGSRVLVVGGGMRAVEIAEECAAAGIRPLVSARGGRVETWSPIILGSDIRHLGFPLLHHLPMQVTRSHCAVGWKFRAIDRGFREFVATKKISITSEISHSDGNDVFFVNGTSFRPDVVIFATGYKFAMPFLPESVRRSPRGYPIVSRGQSSDLRDVYFVGIPCAFRFDSQFVHGMVKDAEAVSTSIAIAQKRRSR